MSQGRLVSELVPHLENIGNKQLKPLIGIEYVVELIDKKKKEPFYICVLCNKRCDPRNIIPQITSHRHRMKYLVSSYRGQTFSAYILFSQY